MIEELNIFSKKIVEKNPKLRIIADLHEKNSLVASELVSFGVGVERTFPLHSPRIVKLKVARKGKTRRSKLYYLRKKVGKKARIKERR